MARLPQFPALHLVVVPYVALVYRRDSVRAHQLYAAILLALVLGSKARLCRPQILPIIDHAFPATFIFLSLSLYLACCNKRACVRSKYFCSFTFSYFCSLSIDASIVNFR